MVSGFYCWTFGAPLPSKTVHPASGNAMRTHYNCAAFAFNPIRQGWLSVSGRFDYNLLHGPILNLVTDRRDLFLPLPLPTALLSDPHSYQVIHSYQFFSLDYGQLEGSRCSRQVRVSLHESRPCNFWSIYFGGTTDNRLRLRDRHKEAAMEVDNVGKYLHSTLWHLLVERSTRIALLYCQVGHAFLLHSFAPRPRYRLPNKLSGICLPKLS
jgi:hypothetical protein